MRSFYLNHAHFAAMLAIALTVHLIIGAIWTLTPGLKINKVPVHVLNIKLGSGDISGMTGLSPAEENKTHFARIAAHPNPTPPPHKNERQQTSAPAKNKNAIEKAPEKQVSKPAARKDEDVIHAQNFASSSSASNAPLAANANPSQYVRRSGQANGVGAGSAMGNSIDPQADIMQRYTQLISMWINRHRNILNRALQPGMKGNVVIRLRIDRRGNIHYFKLDKATGVPMVDAAAAEMVRAANPVPPVPSNYPGGNMFEFLIPVGYTFQQ